MVLSLRKFAAISAMSLFILTQNACTQQNKTEQQTAQNQETLAMADASKDDYSSRVLAVSSVGEAKKGKSTDFKFMKNDKEMSFSELTKGKYVLLNFWGTWCPPCRAEIPDLIEISKEYEAKGLIVIGIAMERSSSIEGAMKTVFDFSKAKNMPYVNFIGTKEITQNYGGIPFVPTTFLIDKEGNIVEKIEGGRSKAQFVESLNKMIK